MYISLLPVPSAHDAVFVPKSHRGLGPAQQASTIRQGTRQLAERFEWFLLSLSSPSACVVTFIKIATSRSREGRQNSSSISSARSSRLKLARLSVSSDTGSKLRVSVSWRSSGTMGGLNWQCKISSHCIPLNHLCLRISSAPPRRFPVDDLGRKCQKTSYGQGKTSVTTEKDVQDGCARHSSTTNEKKVRDLGCHKKV